MCACAQALLGNNKSFMTGMFSGGLMLLLVGSCLGGGCATRRADHVFIVSIDGGNPAVMQRSAMPTLQRLAREGAHSWTAQTIAPSITLPSHTSMLTGVLPGQHGVTWNSWSPTNGLIAQPSVFAAASAAGLRTAMFVGKEKFRHFLQPGAVQHFDFEAANSTNILKSASGGPEVKKTGAVYARFVAARAADHIRTAKPNLTFIHLTDPDTVGHEFGWDSPEQHEAFAHVDAALTELMRAIDEAGLTHRSVLLISADHGGLGKVHNLNRPEDTTIPWIAWGCGVKRNYEITAPVGTFDTATTALWLLNIKPLARMDGTPVTSAFK
jgi:predicted AlkP superfamily pyrophosphatase or phosphodiesterase